MSEPLPGLVTTADLYRKLETIAENVIRLEERAKSLPDLESRLRVLERFRFTLMGVALAGGSLAGYLSSYLLAKGH